MKTMAERWLRPALNRSELDQDRAVVLSPRIEMPQAETPMLAKLPRAMTTAKNSAEFW